MNRILLAAFWLCLLTAAAPVIADQVKGNQPDSLRVLIWNVYKGTNEVNQGPEKALKLIQDSKADICLLQESYDIKGDRPQFGPWAAEQLGWTAWQGASPHLCVITHYKVRKRFFYKPWYALGLELEDDKGRTLHAFSIWMDSSKYLPDFLQENPKATDAELLACESARHERAKEFTAYLEKESLTSLQTPLLVGGDWNCPSHLDWTAATSKALPYRRNLPLPVSKVMEEAGFADGYRTMYPDPVKCPGNTWSPLLRNAEEATHPMDRIDRLYYKSNRKMPWLKSIRTTIFPETTENIDVPERERKFPSDHSALVFEFQWQKADTSR